MPAGRTLHAAIRQQAAVHDATHTRLGADADEMEAYLLRDVALARSQVTELKALWRRAGAERDLLHARLKQAQQVGLLCRCIDARIARTRSAAACTQPVARPSWSTIPATSIGAGGDLTRPGMPCRAG
jgi:hypothetical protein